MIPETVMRGIVSGYALRPMGNHGLLSRACYHFYQQIPGAV